MKHSIWSFILIGLLTASHIHESMRVTKLEKLVKSFTVETITQTDLKTVESKVDGVSVKLDSLFKAIEKPKVKQPIVRLKKRHTKDSAEIAHIEHVIFHELLREEVDSSMARIIVAIAKHESRSFNSGLFTGTNNLFGMTYPPKRPTLATGHKVYLDNGNIRKFCKFVSVSEATRDMVLYLKHWKYPLDIQTPEQMVRIMKSKRYFEAPEGLYLQAVKKHLSQLSV